MSKLFEDIMDGLNEALADARPERVITNRRTLMVIPVKKYNGTEVRNIREKTGLSQRMFAEYMGVSPKTVEAWEANTNHPSGAASRILSMMEQDDQLIERFPFVQKTLKVK